MTNKEFGEYLAEEMWKEGLRNCPFVLNSEQASALQNRWKELSKIKKYFLNIIINNIFYIV